MRSPMRPKHGQMTYFDEVVRGLENKLIEGKREGYREDFLWGMQCVTDLLRDEAKVIYIDLLTLNSLYNVPHGNINYEKSVKLPFPTIFFEFEGPIEFQTRKGKKSLRGMFYLSMKEAERLGYETQNATDDSFRIGLAINGDPESVYLESINFAVSNLPQFMYSGLEEIYAVTKDRKVNSFDSNGNFIKNISSGGNFRGISDRSELREFPKIIDLSLNLINLINAQNVVIVKEIRDPDYIRGINKKRKKKGKKELLEPKPYYWIDMKKSYVTYADDVGKREGVWELKNRVWVIGHFRHFQDGRCTYIWPHIRGPPNAPWRHHRYAMQYANFRRCLLSRGDEDP